MKHLVRSVLAATALAAGAAQAADIDSIQLLSQQEYRAFSQDLGAALSYKPLTPAEPLGITGFDVGVAVTATELKNKALFDRVTSNGNLPSYLPVPTVRALKGLPFGIDVGVMASAIPGTNIRLFGGELRYAIISGNVALPAVAIRGNFSKMTGVSQLDFDTKGIDLSISKGFLNFTPYGGLGKVWVSSSPNGVPGLTKETFSLNKVFVGVNVNFLLVNFALEADRTGDNNTVGIKTGFRF